MILNRIRAAADAPVSQRDPTAPREQLGERVTRASSSSRAHSDIGRLGATLRLVESARQRRCEPILENRSACCFDSQTATTRMPSPSPVVGDANIDDLRKLGANILLGEATQVQPLLCQPTR